MKRSVSLGHSYPFHVAVLRLVTALVLTTALGIGVSTYRNTRDAVQQLSNELTEEAAGQTVPHVHFHIVPRYAAQSLRGHAREQQNMDVLKAHAARVVAALAKLQG